MKDTMKATGIVREADSAGRISLSIEMAIRWVSTGSKMEIYENGQRIILYKRTPSFRICSSCEGLAEIDYEKHVCQNCVALVADIANK